MLLRLYRWYGKLTVWFVIGIILLLSILSFISPFSGTTNLEQPDTKLPTVVVSPANVLSGDTDLSLIGSVSAKSEADVTSEISRRITAVRVVLGDNVQAGQVIATLENASEAAAVLQAEGVYESSQASAEQSNVSVADAQTDVIAANNTAINAYKAAYSVNQDIVYNLVDDFFSNPRSLTPGLRISGGSQTSFLNTERFAFESILPTWQNSVSILTTGSNLDAAQNEAEEITNRVFTVVEILYALVNDNNNNGRTIESQSMQAYSAELAAARSSLVATQNALANARTTRQSAITALQRAQLAGTTGTLSTANAQVKQALGSLRSAQANYAKTILRAPISGTVNQLSIKTGDFVSAQQPVATIANNNALEVTVFVGEKDRDKITVGDSFLIEGKYDGIVSRIAPAVNEDTKKTEVIIATDTSELKNGDTVRVTRTVTDATPSETQTIRLPISAIRFAAEDGSVFTVTDDGVVEAHEVQLGTIRGSLVEVIQGVTPDMNVIVDARGISAGDQVEAILAE